MDDAIDILTLRKRLGWSQDRLAQHLGVDRSSVSRMEREKQPLSGPVAKLLDHLAAGTSVTPTSETAA